LKHRWSCTCFRVSCLLKHKLVTAPDCVTRESCQPFGRLPAGFVGSCGSCSRHCQSRDHTFPQALLSSYVHTSHRASRCLISRVTRRVCILGSRCEFSVLLTSHIGCGAGRTPYPFGAEDPAAGGKVAGMWNCVKFPAQGD